MGGFTLRTRLVASYLILLTGDDVALPLDTVQQGLCHVLSLEPDTGLDLQWLVQSKPKSSYASQFLAGEKLNLEANQQRRRTEWRSFRRLFPNRRPQQMAFWSAVAQQRFCSAFCWAAACSDDGQKKAPRASQRLHLEREAEWESRSEAVRTGETPVLPPVRKREADREQLPFGAIDARL